MITYSLSKGFFILPSYKKLLIRANALLLVVTFLASELAYAAPGIQAPVATLSAQQILLQNPTLFETPSEYVTLKEVHPGTNGKLIIHIQDAHANVSGQESLAGALDQIMSRYGVSLVLSEGGTADCSLTPVKKIASPEVWKQLAKNYLMQGKISGEEYLNLTSDHPMKIMGLEDVTLYLESVKNYGALADKREAILNYLKQVRSALAKLKVRLYPAPLVDYEKKMLHSGESSKATAENFEALLELAQNQKVDLSSFPAVSSLIELKLKEQLVDFKLANLEQAAIVDEIHKLGGGEEMAAFLQAVSRMKDAKAAQYAYFQNMMRTAHTRNISLSSYPHLMQYGEYLDFFSKLDLDKVLDELVKVEDTVYKTLLTVEDARLVRSIDRYAGLLQTAYSIQMSTKEFEQFKANEPDFGTAPYLAFINRKLTEQGYFEDLIPYCELMERGKASLEAFYASVSRRDEAFVKNTERILASEDQKVAVLIAGGYHTPHLKALLAEKGYAVAVLTPVVTGETDQKKYEKLLLSPLRPEPKRVETVQGESHDGGSMSSLEKDLIHAKKASDGVRTAALRFAEGSHTPGDEMLLRLSVRREGDLEALLNDAVMRSDKYKNMSDKQKIEVVEKLMVDLRGPAPVRSSSKPANDRANDLELLLKSANQTLHDLPLMFLDSGRQGARMAKLEDHADELINILWRRLPSADIVRAHLKKDLLYDASSDRAVLSIERRLKHLGFEVATGYYFGLYQFVSKLRGRLIGNGPEQDKFEAAIFASIENLSQHGGHYGTVLVRRRALDKTHDVLEYVVLDKGRGFVDTGGHHIEIERAAEFASSPGQHGEAGEGLTRAIDYSDIYRVTNFHHDPAVHGAQQKTRGYFWEKTWKGKDARERDWDGPAIVDHGTKVYGIKRVIKDPTISATKTDRTVGDVKGITAPPSPLEGARMAGEKNLAERVSAELGVTHRAVREAFKLWVLKIRKNGRQRLKKEALFWGKCYLIMTMAAILLVAVNQRFSESLLRSPGPLIVGIDSTDQAEFDAMGEAHQIQWNDLFGPHEVIYQMGGPHLSTLSEKELARTRTGFFDFSKLNYKVLHFKRLSVGYEHIVNGRWDLLITPLYFYLFKVMAMAIWGRVASEDNRMRRWLSILTVALPVILWVQGAYGVLMNGANILAFNGVLDQFLNYMGRWNIYFSPGDTTIAMRGLPFYGIAQTAYIWGVAILVFGGFRTLRNLNRIVEHRKAREAEAGRSGPAGARVAGRTEQFFTAALRGDGHAFKPMPIKFGSKGPDEVLQQSDLGLWDADPSIDALLISNMRMTADGPLPGIISGQILSRVLTKGYLDSMLNALKEALNNAVIWGNRNKMGNAVVVRWKKENGYLVLDVIDQGTEPINFLAQKMAPATASGQYYGVGEGFSVYIRKYLDEAHLHGDVYDFPLMDQTRRIGQILRFRFPLSPTRAARLSSQLNRIAAPRGARMSVESLILSLQAKIEEAIKKDYKDWRGGVGVVLDLRDILKYVQDPDLREELAAEIAQLYSNTFDQSIAGHKSWLLDRFKTSSPDKNIYLLFNSQGTLKGLIYFSIDRRTSTATMPALAVDPRQSGSGGGTFLMDVMMEELQRQGVASVDWEAIKNSKGFYEKYLEGHEYTTPGAGEFHVNVNDFFSVAVAAARVATISGHEVFEILKSKYGIRHILRGGPIRQPDLFVAFRRNEKILEFMNRHYGHDLTRDHSYAPLMSDPTDIQDFRIFARSMVSGQTPLPLIYKPNSSALGDGIFFVERDRDGNFIITMALIEAGHPIDDATSRVKKYLSSIGIKPIKRDLNQGTISFVLKKDRKDFDVVFSTLWNRASADFGDVVGSYDSGMMESVMPFVRYHGKAYETRHSFKGDLSLRQITFKRDEHRISGWFARVGSSAYFSNQFGRRGKSYELGWRKMFDPLYEMFSITEASRPAFEKVVEEKIEKEFIYLAERLKQAGIDLSDVDGEFDLMWLPPDPTSNGFPIPVLVEANVQPDHGREFKRVFEVKSLPAVGKIGARVASLDKDILDLKGITKSSFIATYTEPDRSALAEKIIGVLEGMNLSIGEAAGELLVLNSAYPIRINRQRSIAKVVSKLAEFRPYVRRDVNKMKKLEEALGQLFDLLGNTEGRDFIKNTARLIAHIEFQRYLEAGPTPIPALPAQPQGLEASVYLDLASGLNFVSFMERLDPRARYILVDNSPFVVTALNTIAGLFWKYKEKHIPLEAINKDVTQMGKPVSIDGIVRPIGTIRMNNIWQYVPGVTGELDKFAGWVADGGQIVIQGYPISDYRKQTIRLADDFIQRMIDQGWRISFSMADNSGYWDQRDTLILSKPAAGQPVDEENALKNHKKWIRAKEILSADWVFVLGGITLTVGPKGYKLFFGARMSTKEDEEERRRHTLELEAMQRQMLERLRSLGKPKASINKPDVPPPAPIVVPIPVPLVKKIIKPVRSSRPRLDPTETIAAWRNDVQAILALPLTMKERRARLTEFRGLNHEKAAWRIFAAEYKVAADLMEKTKELGTTRRKETPEVVAAPPAHKAEIARPVVDAPAQEAKAAGSGWTDDERREFFSLNRRVAELLGRRREVVEEEQLKDGLEKLERMEELYKVIDPSDPNLEEPTLLLLQRYNQRVSQMTRRVRFAQAGRYWDISSAFFMKKAGMRRIQEQAVFVAGNLCILARVVGKDEIARSQGIVQSMWLLKEKLLPLIVEYKKNGYPLEDQCDYVLNLMTYLIKEGGESARPELTSMTRSFISENPQIGSGAIENFKQAVTNNPAGARMAGEFLTRRLNRDEIEKHSVVLPRGFVVQPAGWERNKLSFPDFVGEDILRVAITGVSGGAPEFKVPGRTGRGSERVMQHIFIDKLHPENQISVRYAVKDGNDHLIVELLGENKEDTIPVGKRALTRASLFESLPTGRVFLDRYLGVTAAAGSTRAIQIRDALLRLHKDQCAIVRSTTNFSASFFGEQTNLILSKRVGGGQFLYYMLMESSMQPRYILIGDWMNPENYVVYERIADKDDPEKRSVVFRGEAERVVAASGDATKNIMATDLPEMRRFYREVTRRLHVYVKEKGPFGFAGHRHVYFGTATPLIAVLKPENYSLPSVSGLKVTAGGDRAPDIQDEYLEYPICLLDRRALEAGEAAGVDGSASMFPASFVGAYENAPEFVAVRRGGKVAYLRKLPARHAPDMVAYGAVPEDIVLSRIVFSKDGNYTLEGFEYNGTPVLFENTNHLSVTALAEIFKGIPGIHLPERLAALAAPTELSKVFITNRSYVFFNVSLREGQLVVSPKRVHLKDLRQLDEERQGIIQQLAGRDGQAAARLGAVSAQKPANLSSAPERLEPRGARMAEIRFGGSREFLEALKEARTAPAFAADLIADLYEEVNASQTLMPGGKQSNQTLMLGGKQSNAVVEGRTYEVLENGLKINFWQGWVRYRVENETIILDARNKSDDAAEYMCGTLKRFLLQRINYILLSRPEQAARVLPALKAAINGDEGQKKTAFEELQRINTAYPLGFCEISRQIPQAAAKEVIGKVLLAHHPFSKVKITADSPEDIEAVRSVLIGLARLIPPEHAKLLREIRVDLKLAGKKPKRLGSVLPILKGIVRMHIKPSVDRDSFQSALIHEIGHVVDLGHPRARGIWQRYVRSPQGYYYFKKHFFLVLVSLTFGGILMPAVMVINNNLSFWDILWPVLPVIGSIPLMIIMAMFQWDSYAQNHDGFMSLYAEEDSLEDLAEAYREYVIHRELFHQRAKSFTDVASRYQAMQIIFGDKEERGRAAAAARVADESTPSPSYGVPAALADRFLKRMSDQLARDFEKQGLLALSDRELLTEISEWLSMYSKRYVNSSAPFMRSPRSVRQLITKLAAGRYHPDPKSARTVPNNVAEWEGKAIYRVMSFMAYPDVFQWTGRGHKSRQGDFINGVQKRIKQRLGMLSGARMAVTTAMTWNRKRSMEVGGEILAALNTSAGDLTYDGMTNKKGLLRYGRKIYDCDTAIWRNDRREPIAFMRIGYLMFMDRRLYDQLDPALQRKYQTNIIQVADLAESFLMKRMMLGLHTVVAILQLMNTDMKGKLVVDAGAGDGILSLVGLKLGASRVVLIENNGEAAAAAQKNLQLNGYQGTGPKESRDFVVLRRDLRYLVRRMISERVPAKGEDIVVVCNIGSWPGYRGATNQTVMQCIGLIEKALRAQVKNFIASGYDQRSDDYRNDQAAVTRFGFQVDPRIARVRFDKRFKETRYGWSASKGARMSLSPQLAVASAVYDEVEGRKAAAKIAKLLKDFVTGVGNKLDGIDTDGTNREGIFKQIANSVRDVQEEEGIDDILGGSDNPNVAPKLWQDVQFLKIVLDNEEQLNLPHYLLYLAGLGSYEALPSARDELIARIRADALDKILHIADFLEKYSVPSEERLIDTLMKPQGLTGKPREAGARVAEKLDDMQADEINQLVDTIKADLLARANFQILPDSLRTAVYYVIQHPYEIFESDGHDLRPEAVVRGVLGNYPVAATDLKELCLLLYEVLDLSTIYSQERAYAILRADQKKFLDKTNGKDLELLELKDLEDLGRDLERWLKNLDKYGPQLPQEDAAGLYSGFEKEFRTSVKVVKNDVLNLIRDYYVDRRTPAKTKAGKGRDQSGYGFGRGVLTADEAAYRDRLSSLFHMNKELDGEQKGALINAVIRIKEQSLALRERFFGGRGELLNILAHRNFDVDFFIHRVKEEYGTYTACMDARGRPLFTPKDIQRLLFSRVIPAEWVLELIKDGLSKTDAVTAALQWSNTHSEWAARKIVRDEIMKDDVNITDANRMVLIWAEPGVEWAKRKPVRDRLVTVEKVLPRDATYAVLRSTNPIERIAAIQETATNLLPVVHHPRPTLIVELLRNSTEEVVAWLVREKVPAANIPSLIAPLTEYDRVFGSSSRKANGARVADEELSVAHGFRVPINGQEAYAKGLLNDSRFIRNFIRASSTRQPDGKRVVPKILRIYIPKLRWDENAMIKARLSGYPPVDTPGQSEPFLRKATSEELSPEIERLFEDAAKEQDFELIELNDLKQYWAVARQLDIASGLQQQFVEKMIRQDYLLVVSEWGGPMLHEVVKDASVDTNRLEQVGYDLGMTLRAIHDGGLFPGENRTDHFVVRDRDVLRIDIGEIRSSGQEGLPTRIRRHSEIVRELTMEPPDRPRNNPRYQAVLRGFLKAYPVPAPQVGARVAEMIPVNSLNDLLSKLSLRKILYDVQWFAKNARFPNTGGSGWLTPAEDSFQFAVLHRLPNEGGPSAGRMEIYYIKDGKFNIFSEENVQQVLVTQSADGRRQIHAAVAQDKTVPVGSNITIFTYGMETGQSEPKEIGTKNVVVKTPGQTVFIFDENDVLQNLSTATVFPSTTSRFLTERAERRLRGWAGTHPEDLQRLLIQLEAEPTLRSAEIAKLKQIITHAARVAIRKDNVGFQNSRNDYITGAVIDWEPISPEREPRMVALPDSLRSIKYSLPWPVDMTDPSAHVVGFFGKKNYNTSRASFAKFGRLHGAIDIQARAGTPVLSVIDGVVLNAEKDDMRFEGAGGELLGTVRLYSPSLKLLIVYDHLKWDSIPERFKQARFSVGSLASNPPIAAGEIVGEVGRFNAEVIPEVQIPGDVLAVHGRRFDNVHFVTAYVPDSLDNVGKDFEKTQLLNPLRLLAKLYEFDEIDETDESYAGARVAQGSAVPGTLTKAELSRLRRWVENTPMVKFSQGANAFYVYRATSPAPESYPVVIKVPQALFPHQAQRLLRNLEFVKAAMGGLIAPFVVLEDTSVNGVRYPFVMVQKKLDVFQERLPAKREPQKTELFLETVRRGILLTDAPVAKNFGVDRSDDRLYFVDNMDPEDPAKVSLAEAVHLGRTEWQIQFDQALWASALQNRHRVDDVPLPDAVSAGARVAKAQAAPEKWWGADMDDGIAQNLMTLGHPNLMRIRKNGDRYEEQEIPGKRSSEWVSEHFTLSIEEITPILVQWVIRLADGVAALYRVGIEHRDISPTNVLIAEDTQEPVLIDFNREGDSGSDIDNIRGLLLQLLQIHKEAKIWRTGGSELDVRRANQTGLKIAAELRAVLNGKYDSVKSFREALSAYYSAHGPAAGARVADIDRTVAALMALPNIKGIADSSYADFERAVFDLLHGLSIKEIRKLVEKVRVQSKPLEATHYEYRWLIQILENSSSRVNQIERTVGSVLIVGTLIAFPMVYLITKDIGWAPWAALVFGAGVLIRSVAGGKILYLNGARVAEQAQRHFNHSFGGDALAVLTFLSGRTDVREIETYELPRLVQVVDKGGLHRQVYEHTLKLRGADPIVFFEKIMESHRPEHYRFVLDYLQREADITKVAYSAQVGPESLFLADKKILLVKHARGIPLSAIHPEKVTREMIEAIGFSLGRLHAAGIYHNDLINNFYEHIYLEQGSDGRWNVSFIDFSLSRIDKGATLDEFSQLSQELRHAYPHLKTHETGPDESFEQAYKRGVQSYLHSGDTAAARVADGTVSEHSDENKNGVITTLESRIGPVEIVRTDSRRYDIRYQGKSILSEATQGFHPAFEWREIKAGKRYEVFRASQPFIADEKMLQIAYMYLDDDYQNRGIGTIVLKWLVLHAAARGCTLFGNLGTRNPKMIEMILKFLKSESVRFWIADAPADWPKSFSLKEFYERMNKNSDQWPYTVHIRGTIDLSAEVLQGMHDGAGARVAEWNLEKVEMEQVDSSFQKWVEDGHMDPQDLDLLKQILMGEEQLQILLPRCPGKVSVKHGEVERDGRTVYLRLNKPFPISQGQITFLRIKGARPRKSAGSDSHQGSGSENHPTVVDDQGNIRKEGMAYGPATVGLTPFERSNKKQRSVPQGAALKKDAALEYRLMQEGLKGLGFETDYPIAWGTWKGRKHKGRAVGFVIAGMRGPDWRLQSTPANDAAKIVKDVISDEEMILDDKQIAGIYESLGRSLRAYHDAGYFHRFLHGGNIGILRNSDGSFSVILKDLDTTVRVGRRSKLRSLKISSNRLIDIQRTASDDDAKQFSFLKGYFKELNPDGDEFRQLFSAVASVDFYSMLWSLNDRREPMSMKEESQKNSPIGIIWKKLYEVSAPVAAARVAERSVPASAAEPGTGSVAVTDDVARFSSIYGARLSEKKAIMDDIVRSPEDLNRLKLLAYLFSKGWLHDEEYAFLFDKGIGLLHFAGSDIGGVSVTSSYDQKSFELTPTQVRVEGETLYKAREVVQTHKEIVHDAVVEQLLWDEKVIGQKAERTWKEIAQKMPNAFDADSSTVHLVPVNKDWSPEYRRLVKRQADVSGPGESKRTFVVFTSDLPGIEAEMNEGLTIPWSRVKQVMVHGDVDEIDKEHLKDWVREKLAAISGRVMPAGLRVGYTSSMTEKTGTKQVAVMPFITAEIVYSDIIARLDADKVTDLTGLADMLKPLLALLKIHDGFELLREKSTITYLQNYAPKHFELYRQLAIQAIVRLDLDQFVKYTEMALAVGAAA